MLTWMKATLTGKLYFYYIETIAIMIRMIIMIECEIWGNEYEKNGYAGDVVPANWDNYILIEGTEDDNDNAEVDNVVDNGINYDINEEHGDDQDGFALVVV